MQCIGIHYDATPVDQEWVTPSFGSAVARVASLPPPDFFDHPGPQNTVLRREFSSAPNEAKYGERRVVFEDL